jgi:hypothetical protein
MRNMMKFATWAALLMAVSASAQQPNQVRVTVPFAFTAGGTTMSAGEYRVALDLERELVTLRGPQSLAIFHTMPNGRTRGHEALRFKRSGDHLALQEIVVGGTGWDISTRPEASVDAGRHSARKKDGTRAAVQSLEGRSE